MKLRVVLIKTFKMNDKKSSSQFKDSTGFVLLAIFLLIGLTFLGQIGFLIAILFMGFILRYQKISITAIGLKRPKSWLKTTMLGIFLAVLILALFLLIINPMLQGFLPIEEKNLERFATMKGNTLYFLIGIISSIVTAGFGEEIIWRGYILRRLATIFGNRSSSWVIALLITSVLFGCLHFYQGMVGIVQTGFTGFLLGLIFILNGKKSLWVNIIAHSTIDIISLTAIYLGAI